MINKQFLRCLQIQIFDAKNYTRTNIKITYILRKHSKYTYLSTNNFIDTYKYKHLHTPNTPKLCKNKSSYKQISNYIHNQTNKHFNHTHQSTNNFINKVQSFTEKSYTLSNIKMIPSNKHLHPKIMQKQI